jgi:hypothetical protein
MIPIRTVLSLFKRTVLEIHKPQSLQKIYRHVQSVRNLFEWVLFNGMSIIVWKCQVWIQFKWILTYLRVHFAHLCLLFCWLVGLYVCLFCLGLLTRHTRATMQSVRGCSSGHQNAATESIKFKQRTHRANEKMHSTAKIARSQSSVEKDFVPYFLTWWTCLLNEPTVDVRVGLKLQLYSSQARVEKDWEGECGGDFTGCNKSTCSKFRTFFWIPFWKSLKVFRNVSERVSEQFSWKRF